MMLPHSNLRQLGETDLKISGLGFGCAPMMGRVGKGASLTALAKAFDAGINFYDVARSYGYGEAEGVLGAFLKGRREQAVIATKAGIQAAAQSPAKKIARSLIRPILPWSKWLLKHVRHQARREFVSGVFDPRALQSSLEKSLQMLQTDHVDILYLHDILDEQFQNEAVIETCLRFVNEGKVRYLGLATERTEMLKILSKNPGVFQVVSVTNDIADPFVPDPVCNGIGLIGRQPFGGHGGLVRLRKELPALKNLSVKEAAGVALAWAIHHSGMDSVVASFFGAEHVEQNLQVLDNPEYQEEICQVLHSRLLGIHE